MHSQGTNSVTGANEKLIRRSEW